MWTKNSQPFWKNVRKESGGFDSHCTLHNNNNEIIIVIRVIMWILCIIHASCVTSPDLEQRYLNPLWLILTLYTAISIRLHTHHTPAAVEALKNGPVGASPREESGVVGGMLPQGNLWKYRCKSVQFSALFGHQVIRNATESRRFAVPFLAYDSMLLSALYAIANPSVWLSVCPSHGWISWKRLKLRSCNFHHTVAPSLSFCRISFIQKFWRHPPEQGLQTMVGCGLAGNKIHRQLLRIHALPHYMYIHPHILL